MIFIKPALKISQCGRDGDLINIHSTPICVPLLKEK